MGLFASKSRSEEQLDELMRRNEALLRINALLEKRLAELSHQTTGVTGTGERKVMDIRNNPQLMCYIEQILQDPACNIKYLPDAVERHMYRTIFQSVIGLLDKVVSSSKIELLGHEITLSMNPSTSEESLPVYTSDASPLTTVSSSSTDAEDGSEVSYTREIGTAVETQH